MLKGFIIGIGKIVPGVSGAMLAITLGVYDKAIQAFTGFTSDIKKNFKYTILETFNSNVDDKIIIGENKDGEGGREGFWKDVLLSRKFGYNAN